MVSQTEAILALLRERGEAGLTPIEALTLVGSFRLAARIADAKQLIRPDEVIVNVGTGTSTGKHIARYVLRRIEPTDITLWAPGELTEAYGR